MSSFIFWPQVCLSLHNAPSEFCSISESPDKYLSQKCTGQGDCWLVKKLWSQPGRVVLWAGEVDAPLEAQG